jgi:hypothetical protein
VGPVFHPGTSHGASPEDQSLPQGFRALSRPRITQIKKQNGTKQNKNLIGFLSGLNSLISSFNKHLLSILSIFSSGTGI